MKIILLSDNHGYFDDELIPHLKSVDEIWHAGDMGDLHSIDKLKAFAPLIGVYGNIDDHLTRAEYPLNQFIEREGLKVFMTHIGGYPGRYYSRVRKILEEYKPNLYICGHSHICKVMPDKKLNLIHMNPGSYGNHGFHKIRTVLKFEILNTKILNLQAIELGLRGKIQNNGRN